MNVDAIRRGVPGAEAIALLARRARGEFDIDEWGLDPDLVALADPLFAARWDIEVSGADQLPAIGGAALVFNRRIGLSEPWVLARGVRRATGRFVRTVGVPDRAPVGPFVRRFGGVLDRTDEVAGLLLAGQLVGLPTSRDLRSRLRAGSLEVARIEAAWATGAPVFPVALVGRESGRSWRAIVGAPVARPRTGGPLAAVELAEATQHALQTQLDDALPASWWR